jgi:hypothetical protein
VLCSARGTWQSGQVQKKRAEPEESFDLVGVQEVGVLPGLGGLPPLLEAEDVEQVAAQLAVPHSHVLPGAGYRFLPYETYFPLM